MMLSPDARESKQVCHSVPVRSVQCTSSCQSSQVLAEKFSSINTERENLNM